MTRDSFGNDIEAFNALRKKMEEDLIRELKKQGLEDMTTEKLKKLDIGDIERRLGIIAKDPRKPGYRFVKPEKKTRARNLVTTLLNKQ